MTVLITGGAGYIGSHTALEFLDAGRDVLVVDNLSTGYEWMVPTGASFVQGDVADGDLIRSLIAQHDVDAIIHFAGSIVVPDSVGDPLGYYRNNTAATRSLIESAVIGNVSRFIFSSTAAVYGAAGSTPIPEDAPLSPTSPYGSSKLMSETMLRDCEQAYGLSHVILRYFNVAGADPAGRSGQSSRRATHLIKVASQAALGERSHLDVFGTDYGTPDGTCVRDYIHVSDLAGAHRLALEHVESGGSSRTLNCGYGHGYSVLDVVETVKRVCASDFPVRLEDRRAGDPPSLVSNSEAIRAALGWTPRHDDLETIVRHALDWERTLARRSHVLAAVA